MFLESFICARIIPFRFGVLMGVVLILFIGIKAWSDRH